MKRNYKRDISVFVFVLGIGMMMDVILSQLHEYIHPLETPGNYIAKVYLVLLGFAQILTNIQIVYLLREYKLNTTLVTVGLFIPQTLVLSQIYGTPYTKESVDKTLQSIKSV